MGAHPALRARTTAGWRAIAFRSQPPATSQSIDNEPYDRCCPYGTRLSRRDGAIVAWHEVPGTAPPQKSRPVGYGVIRAGGRADSMIEVTKFRIRKLKNFMLYDLWPTIQFLSMANTFSCLNIHCVFSTKERVWVLNPDIRERLWREIPLGLAAPDHAVPYGTVLSRDAFPGTSCQATIGVVPTGRACRHFTAGFSSPGTGGTTR